MSKKLAVAFTGPSNSGKTTIIEKLSKLLINDLNKEVLIIKNDPKDKATFDYEGKDSFKFSQTGAEVFVTSPNRTTFLSKKHSSIERMIEIANPFDYLFVEGLKNLPLPRIAVFRGSINLDYLPFSEAIAIDNSINLKDYNIPENIDILDLNSPENILKWINENGKEV